MEVPHGFSTFAHIAQHITLLNFSALQCFDPLYRSTPTKKMPTQDSSEEYKTYTPHQVGTYLSHINFPVAEYKHILPGVSTAVETLTCLSALQRFHLAAIPFENLSLHYSPARVISLDKDELFEKMIASGSRRGGYCMEQNLLFGTVLRTMNFNVVSTGARVMGDKRFGGW